MISNSDSQQSMTQESILLHAIEAHQAGNLKAAEEHYRAILKIKPDHPDANHNLGILLVQKDQAEAALPCFLTAIQSDPSRVRYWMSYIKILIQTGQPENARQILSLAGQQGFPQEDMRTLEGYVPTPDTTGDMTQASPHAPEQSKPAKIPGHREMDALYVLFNKGRYKELLNPARKMTGRYPLHGLAWKVLAFTLLQMGQDALQPMQKAAELLPDDIEINFNLGQILHSAGRSEDAVICYRRVLHIQPNHPDAYNSLGALLRELGRLQEVEACFRQQLKIRPDVAQAHSNLGASLLELNRLEEAVTCYQLALQLEPAFSAAHNDLGLALRKLGRLPEALASQKRAIENSPDNAKAHIGYGLVLYELKKHHEAIASFRRALALKPEFAEAHVNLGAVLMEIGQFDGAVEHFQQALAINPHCAVTHNNLGLALSKLGKHSDALASHQHAIDISPDFAEAHNGYGMVLHELGNNSDAEASFLRALTLKPDLAEAHVNFGIMLSIAGKFAEAVTVYQHALAINPHDTKTHNNMGVALQNLGKTDEAAASYRQALQKEPDHGHIFSNMLFLLSHSLSVDSKILFTEHRGFGERFEAPLQKKWPIHSNSREAQRCLQVGIVSADFIYHAIASFIEPLLIQLSGIPQLSLHAYHNHTNEDSVSLRLKGHFAHWHPVAHMSDDALAEKIQADRIDILIDLSGHSGNNRLLTFARKPAPVQASWMGYPGTTGLSAMDYYLSDNFFTPTGQFDDQFTEKIVRMPGSAPFLPSKHAPAVNALPALNQGYITFGSFNRMEKISPPVIALWSQLLRNAPDSRMILGGMPENEKFNTLIELFSKEGISRERLDFHLRSNMETYMELHHQVDFCLDTFPYNGGTTTLHALWMGIPTLTLAGNTCAGRPGAAILGHVGLDDFIALDQMDFVLKGLSIAGNLNALSDIRSSLRERFQLSAMGQPELIAKGLERTLRIIWQRWCAGLPPVSFEVTRQEITEPVFEK